MSYGALTSSFIIIPPSHSLSGCLSVSACVTVCLLLSVGLHIALRIPKLSAAPRRHPPSAVFSLHHLSWS